MRVFLLAIAYAAAGWLGLQLAVPPGYAAVIWPASGIAAGALILYGRMLWPGVLLGSFLVNLGNEGGFGPGGPDAMAVRIAFLIAIGSTFQAIVATTVARAMFGNPLHFAKFREVAVFALVTGPVACLIAPTTGVFTLWSLGILPPDAIAANWLTWWMGDTSGVLIFMPMVIFSPWRPWAVRWSGLNMAGFTKATLLALIVPLGATLYAWKLVGEVAHRQQQAEFNVLAEESLRALTHRIDSYRQSLDGAAGLFGASEVVTASEWRNYVDILDIERNMPGINGIGFIEAVRREDLADVLLRYPDRPMSQIKVHPESDDAELFVIVLIEPMAQNEEALGLNISFERNRHFAAVDARDSGRPTITRRILLVQDETSSPGFLLLRPVYRQAVELDTVEARRAAFDGWVYAPFIGSRFLADLTKTQGVELNLRVYDGDREDPTALIYDSLDADAPKNSSPFRVVRTLSIMEQEWTIVWEGTPAFMAANRSSEPLLILTLGITLSMLFGALLLSYERREEAIRRTVVQKTRSIAAREQETRSIVDSAIAGIVVTDADGIVLSLNKAAEAIFDRPADEAITRPVKEIIESIDANTLHHLTLRADGKASSAPIPSLFTTRRMDGSERALDMQVNRWTTEDGASRFTAIIRDVTDEKFAADLLEKAEKRWNQALQGAEIGVYDINLLTGKSVVSDTWKRIAGFDPDDVIEAQEEFLARVHPDDLPQLMEADRAAIQGRADRSVSEFRFKAKNGDLIWLRSDGFIAERGPDGRALRLIGTQVNVTSFKQATAALRSSEKKFRSAIENAPIGMALVQPDGQMISANNALCRFLGFAEDDVVGRDFLSMMQLVDTENEILSDVNADTFTAYQGDHQFVHTDGRLLWGSLNVSLAHDPDGQPEYLIAQILDINDRMEVDRMKSEFVATISHELRTPLTSIRGSLGLVMGTMSEKIPAKAGHLLSIAHKNCDRLILLINDILDLEKLASDQYHFDLKPEPIGKLVAQAVEANHGYAGQFDVTLEFSDAANDTLVDVDEARFQQVLSNLLSNAAKFSPVGGSVDITIEKRDAVLRVCVADQGPGIAPEFRSKIFQRFSQGDASATRQQGGTGLGLHISRQMMEKMGGTIDFESNTGEGTVFWAELPLRESGQKSRPPSDKVSDDAALQVLHIEDDVDFAEVFAGAFVKRAKVTVASTCELALTEMRSRRFDAVVLDLDLFGQDSSYLLSDPAFLTHDAPVIVLTAHDDRVCKGPVARTFVKSRRPDAEVADAIIELASIARSQSTSANAPRIVN